MLTIRADQIQAFDAVAETMFVDRVSRYLQEHHADTAIRLREGESTVRDLADEMLREFVRNGVVRARAYELSHESALAAFVVLQFESAPNFDDHPLLHRALTDDRGDPNLRIDRLMDQASPENWEAVKERYDANAWFGTSPKQFDGQTTLVDTSRPKPNPTKADIHQGDTDGE
jgi:hypothetical protein